MNTELLVKMEPQGSLGGLQNNYQVPDAAEMQKEDSIYIECLICHQPTSSKGQRCDHTNDPVGIEKRFQEKCCCIRHINS